MKLSLVFKLFRAKIKSHGWFKTLVYSTQFAFDGVYRRWVKEPILHSYSQENEDRILDDLIRKKRGFYVDLGAFDPVKLSNTYRFYKKGWKGLVIEPNRRSWEQLTKIRPRDIHLNIGIGAIEKKALYYFSSEQPGLSTFSESIAENLRQMGVSLTAQKMEVKPLRSLFSSYLGENAIDFLSCDVEGLDREVLESNDWSKYRPTYVCVEVAQFGQNENSEFRIQEWDLFFMGIEYKRVVITYNFGSPLNAIYKDINNNPF